MQLVLMMHSVTSAYMMSSALNSNLEDAVWLAGQTINVAQLDANEQHLAANSQHQEGTVLKPCRRTKGTNSLVD